jgi:hypothetical protein
MAAITPSVSSLSFYKYEPFSNVFTSDVGHTLQFSNSAVELLPFLTQTDSRTVTLEGTFNRSFTYPLSLVLGTAGTAPNVTSTTTITVGVGRFNPPVQGQVYQLYQYENISNTFGSNPPITTVLPITTLVSVPTLTPGISIVSSNYTGQSFNLTGTPVLQQAQSNYKLIGTDSPGSGVVTVDIAIKVNAPRVVITPSSVSVTGMLIGTPITPVIFTAIQPNDNGPTNNFQYAWTPELPDGFSFVNASNVPITSFQYVNPTLPIQLIGTPTVTTANTFVAGGNPYFITLRGYHTTPASQQIIATSVISLSFAETVLVSASIPSPLYENKVLSPTNVVITGRTYFPLGSPIATLTKDALPPGLTLSTPIIAGSLFLEGTPTPASSGTYTFTATNSNGVSRSLAVPITVNANVVTFGTPTPANGASVTFIVSRPLSLETPGFYDKDIRFSATSTSGSSITYSSSLNFAIYGITFSTSTGTLTGVPTSFLAATPVTITATDTLGTSASQIFNVTITPDLFTFPTPAPTFAFFQNRPITPYQFVVTTLSGRIIQSFSGTMPPGLVLSATGLLSGTFTGTVGNTFTVTASTGYQAPPTASQTYSYTAQPDNFLLLQSNAVDVITPIFSNIQFQTVQYSTSQYVNPVYSFSNFFPAEYPAQILTMTPSGVLSGDFTQGPLFSNYVADLTATFSGVTSSTPIVFTFTNPSTSLLIAGYTNAGIGTTSNVGYLGTTTDYVFSATSNGDRVVTDQVWTGGLPENFYLGNGNLYPDLAQYSNTFIAVNVSNVYDGVYNPSTRAVDWTETNPLLALGGGTIIIGRYLSVASDGAGQWVLVQSGGLSGGPAYVYRRMGTGAWGTNPSIPRVNDVQDTTMTYINGRYVFGQASNATDAVPTVYVGTPISPGGRVDWAQAATFPTMSNILRFGTSNTTLVAVGSGAYSGGPISYSTDSGSNWLPLSVPGFMTGATVVLNDVLYAANTWVTCGLESNGSNMIAYSSNLSNWVKYPIPAGNSTVRWSGIAFNGNAWTIAGSRPAGVGSNTSMILSLAATPWPTQQFSIGPLSGVITFLGAGNPMFSKILSTTFSNPNPSTGTVFIPQNSVLSFVEPVQSNLTLYQYVPYSLRVAATGSPNFIFYYATNVPAGITFTPDPTGTFASLSGISPSNRSAVVNVYARTSNSAAVFSQITLNTIIPYFTRPQSGAGAYTAIVRKHVDADAAQNARDSKVYPVVNPLAGPFMAPRAPDVVTMSNCFLGLCKKPCPTCHTMM